ncbi:MAG: DDE transposase [Magnetococcales bacterium]|nr:DDE transposase [Magnetococcales bacterium]HIJ85309.1 ISNCY family transposase [Magnetococcales bacterium]
MRETVKNQMVIGEVGISNISFDLNSRDDIPQLLMGLQYIYVTPDVREKVFGILETMIPSGVSLKNGRPGMELWKILVMGTLRLNLNYDYDRLQEEVNNHHTIRQMLGHSIFDFGEKYRLQTIKDNVSLFTQDILIKINEVIVKAGHSLIKNDEEEKIHGRCDSFVVETDVHFPTDINLLFDAIRKIIQLIAVQCSIYKVNLWDESVYDINKFKKLYRIVQNLKKSTSSDDEQRAIQDEKIIKSHMLYIDLARKYLSKALFILKFLSEHLGVCEMHFAEIVEFIVHAYRQIDQIERRVIHGEKIPHEEKVFSLFELHTEWLNKGKAGVLVELGLNVCVLEDQHGFILHHKVMQNISDCEIAIDMVKETQNMFPDVSTCSFDKGFYSKSNKEELDKILDNCILPKKGKLSSMDKEIEEEDEFKLYRRKHSAVESAINALEVHGLDRCPDHGIDGFKRYVALAVVARNIQKIGSIILNNCRNRKKAA